MISKLTLGVLFLSLGFLNFGSFTSSSAQYRTLSEAESSQISGSLGTIFICGAIMRPCSVCTVPTTCIFDMFLSSLCWGSVDGWNGCAAATHGTCAQYVGCFGCTCGAFIHSTCDTACRKVCVTNMYLCECDC